MNPESIQLALRHHSVRPTTMRRTVLGVLLRSPFALSRADIEQQLAADRITIYRTLRTFEEKGLVHRVVDHAETVRYAAACADSPVPELANNHVHFKCTACQHIYCLSQVPVPVVELAAPYQVERSDYLLSGVCLQCQPPVSDAVHLPAPASSNEGLTTSSRRLK